MPEHNRDRSTWDQSRLYVFEQLDALGDGVSRAEKKAEKAAGAAEDAQSQIDVADARAALLNTIFGAIGGAVVVGLFELFFSHVSK